MNHCFLIDIAIPGDSQVLQKISEKQQCYSDLKIEVQKMWSYRASVAPLIIGSLGSIHANLIPKMQKSALLNSYHILRSFATEH